MCHDAETEETLATYIRHQTNSSLGTLLPKAGCCAHRATMPRPTRREPGLASIYCIEAILLACCKLLRCIILKGAHDVCGMTTAILLPIQILCMLLALRTCQVLRVLWNPRALRAPDLETSHALQAQHEGGKVEWPHCSNNSTSSLKRARGKLF